MPARPPKCFSAIAVSMLRAYSMLDIAVNDAFLDRPYALPDMDSMGDRIRRMREQKGWSMDQLARLIGTTKGAVHQWETGLTVNIRPENLLRLCEEFGTDPWYVVFGPERRAPEPSPPNRTRKTG